MTSTTLRLVLFVSCAHAMVHVYEHALPAVEQMIAADYDVDREATGWLGTVWRVPFGLLAMLGGWLADRYTAKRMLIVYLLGCAGTAGLAWWSPSLAVLFVVMFGMGCFASIYHPAGLALISHETSAATRGAALGWHGIFGSVGIAAAPLLAAVAFAVSSITWHQYYLLLMAPGVVLAVAFAFWLQVGSTETAEAPGGESAINAASSADATSATNAASATNATSAADASDPAHWPAYFMLVAVGAMSGIVYAAFAHFLPRYLNETGELLVAHVQRLEWLPSTTNVASSRTLLAAIVLLCGAVGQGVAGKIARPGRLGWLLAAVLWGNVPCLTAMAFATGTWRLGATCAMGFVHFMNQPIYNSLIAQYVPRARRSLGYGFSNMMCFGLGAVGPGLAGWIGSSAGPEHVDRWTYGSLAMVAAAAALLALVVWRTDPTAVGAKNASS